MEIFKKLFGSRRKIDLDEVRESLASKIADLKRPAVRLEKTSQVKISKFGGKPFVEKNKFAWPRSNGKPMAFLAQLDLAEISSVHHYEWLADEGVILFFYDVLEMPWGFDPKDRGKWCVLYQSKADSYIEYPDDLGDELKIKEVFIKPKHVEILPSYDDPSVEILKLTDEEIDAYIDLNDGSDEALHQLGGFPSSVQGNYMDLESQLASNGIYVGYPKGYESEKAKKLESGAKDWKLLFQFDSDDDLDIMWGDCGMIYFWVQEQKSKINQFDNSWLILQCC
ncbi:YwqG family protein [Psychromonas aquimarina]|uniref:YwqG family protein n=1 Tax=Psychromonas aquimarina TaxID=444919 RepID=UPI0004203A7A|nr:YwqG family protein [Psychromonas aquimarina]